MTPLLLLPEGNSTDEKLTFRALASAESSPILWSYATAPRCSILFAAPANTPDGTRISCPPSSCLTSSFLMSAVLKYSARFGLLSAPNGYGS